MNDISTRCDEMGRQYVWFRPTLLVGNPGCGKSRFARRLAELIGIPYMMFGAAGVADSMFGSNSRKWSGSGPSLPVQTMIRNSIANPVIILDEIDKAQRSQNGSLEDTLLPMLEKSTAASLHDQFIGAPVRLDFVNFVATANDIEKLSPPIRDRFRVMRFVDASDSNLAQLIDTILCESASERGVDMRWIEPFSQSELDAVREHWQGGSIRGLQRLVQGVLDARDHHMQQMSN